MTEAGAHVSTSLRGKRVLITGAAGFIGSHLTDACLAAGAERVVAVDDLYLGRRENLADADRLAGPARFSFLQQDASDLEAMRRICDEHEPDLLFALAVIPLPVSLEDPRFCTERNISLAVTACELAREELVGSLVSFSSSEVYGTARQVPMTEQHPLVPLTPYAASKAAADHIVDAYRATFAIDARTVRPFNNYGPRQNDRAYAGIIPLVIRRVQRGQPVEVFGDGEQTRDFIFARDTAEAAIDAANHPDANGTTLNIGTGHETSVNELIGAILKAMNRQDHPVITRPARPGDVRRHTAGVDAARAMLGFEPRTQLLRGLQETVEWYLTQAPPSD